MRKVLLVLLSLLLVFGVLLAVLAYSGSGNHSVPRPEGLKPQASADEYHFDDSSYTNSEELRPTPSMPHWSASI